MAAPTSAVVLRRRRRTACASGDSARDTLRHPDVGGRPELGFREASPADGREVHPNGLVTVGH